jgi:hypothetical protein
LAYFSNRVSCLCPGWPRSLPSYLCFPHSWDGRACHCTQLLLVDMQSLELFVHAGFEPSSFHLCLLRSWDYR